MVTWTLVLSTMYKKDSILHCCSFSIYLSIYLWYRIVSPPKQNRNTPKLRCGGFFKYVPIFHHLPFLFRPKNYLHFTPINMGTVNDLTSSLNSMSSFQKKFFKLWANIFVGWFYYYWWCCCCCSSVAHRMNKPIPSIYSLQYNESCRD